jgi:predicted phage terminase large subunit-like protein
MKLIEAVGQVDPVLLKRKEGRVALTKENPLLFAAIYLPHMLRLPGQTLEDTTLNQFHLDICDYAKTWMIPMSLQKPRANRDCFIAPRMVGKSTWIFFILPMWAGAHGHRGYITAFSDSEDQATGWLRNFKTELAMNELLASDFPDFVAPMVKTKGGKAIMDNANATQRANGFVFQAKGVDSAILGANIGGRRPEVILFDDIEPPESNYGPTDLKKRKATILTTHFYLNTYANVVFVGTTTMPNSLIDQMRKVGDAFADYEGEPEAFAGTLDPELQWVARENISTHYYPAIVTDDDGVEHSLWPEQWPLEELDAARGTREFAMNMMNKPLSGEEGYWDDSDIAIDYTDFGNTVLSVDPAVTTARRSDYTAFTVLSRGKDNKVYIRHSEAIKGTSEAITERTKELVEQFGVGVVLVETNQGGDLWKQVFKDVGARVRFMTQRTKKEVRIGQCADYYKKGRVIHTRHFGPLEEQMLAYPHVQHDDLVDSVTTGVLYFEKNKGNRITVTQHKYMEVG